MNENRISELKRIIKHKNRLNNYQFIQQILLIMFLIGGVSNFIAVTRNDCHMPVITKTQAYYDYNYSTKHIIVNDSKEVNYSFLGDIFETPYSIFSIGDFLMVSSIFLMFLQLIVFLFTKNRV